jgi:hypothetical protein
VLLEVYIAIAGALALFSFVLAFVRTELDVDGVRGLQEYFDVDRESTIPAWLTSSLLLLAALATASLNRKLPPDRQSRYWHVLAFVLLVMSADEAVAVHEEVGDQLDQLLDVGGALRYAWVIPAALIVLGLALTSRGAFRKLPRGTARTMLLGIALYLSGALLLEPLGSSLKEADDASALAVAAQATVEELLEMLGVGVYLYALLVYLTVVSRTTAVANAER